MYPPVINFMHNSESKNYVQHDENDGASDPKQPINIRLLISQYRHLS
jgi:hypothetical protein